MFKKSVKRISIFAMALNIVIVLFFIITWAVNIAQFMKCDFESPYKKEIIKGVGIAGLSFITVWIANDEK